MREMPYHNSFFPSLQEEIEKELKEDFGMLPKDALKWYDELGGESYE